MKFCSAVILAVVGTAPSVLSFSYLESLSGPSGTTSSSIDIAPPLPASPAETESPFFFTNGAHDEPMDNAPAFYFTNGSTDVPATAAQSTGSYLDNLNGAGFASSEPFAEAEISRTPTSAAYLDYIGTGVTSVSGPGMANYLDALPRNSANAGPGLSSYASTLNMAASEFIAASAVEPLPATSVAEPSPEIVPMGEISTSAASNPSAYLEALSTGASTNGAGIATYLDTLPQTSTLSGGAGISTYASNLVSSNVINGAGVSSYTDAIGGGISSFTNSFSPFASAASSSGRSDFAIGSVNGRFDLTLEASEEIIAQLQACSGKVTIQGKLTNIMLN